MKVETSTLPTGTLIHSARADADFADCYQFDDLWPTQNALQTYLTLVARTPTWMNALMNIRNHVVRCVGLKHLHNNVAPPKPVPADAYQVGHQVGIFRLEHIQDDEVVLFDDDKHLKVQVSLAKHTVGKQSKVSFSTVVHIHNGLGHLYMGVVGPVHKIIVPRMLAQVAHA